MNGIDFPGPQVIKLHAWRSSCDMLTFIRIGHSVIIAHLRLTKPHIKYGLLAPRRTFPYPRVCVKSKGYEPNRMKSDAQRESVKLRVVARLANSV
jgi:hypothetical protein